MARWEKVTVDIAKLQDYCLDPQHPRCKHKARVFEMTLGLTSDGAHLLREALLTAVRTREEHMQMVEKDEYGQRYLLVPCNSNSSSKSRPLLRAGFVVPPRNIEI